MKQPELTLAAEDAEDLEIISARLQDAVAAAEGPGLAAEEPALRGAAQPLQVGGRRAKTDLRTRSLLHFDDVLSAQSRGLKRGAPDAVVSLLAIRFTPKGAEDPGGTVELVFAGGGSIRLEVECIDAGLSDVSGDWAARGRPDHDET